MIERTPKQFVLLRRLMLTINWLNNEVGTEGEDLERNPVLSHTAYGCQG